MASEDARRRRGDGVLRPEPEEPHRHHHKTCRSLAAGGPGEDVLRLRRDADGLPDAGDRAQRARRRCARDAVVGQQRAVPAERAHLRPTARSARRAPGHADRIAAVYRRRRARVVAAARGVGGDRPRGLRPGDRDVEERPGAREPQSARLVPAGSRRPHVDRHRPEPRRADDQLRVDEGLRRPEWPPTRFSLVSGCQVAVARRAAGRR